MTTRLPRTAKFLLATMSGLLWAGPILVALIFVWCVVQYDKASDPRLQIEGTSPFGILSLQLIDSAKTAEAIVSSWASPARGLNGLPPEKRLIDVAVKNLDFDCLAILLYVVSYGIALIWAAWRLKSKRSNSWMLGIVTGLCLVSLITAAGIDCGIENPGLRRFLEDRNSITEEAVAEVRLAAQVKFALLSLVVAWLAASFFAVIRRAVIDSSRNAELGGGAFSELYQKEQVVIRGGTPPLLNAMGDEPWIRDQSADRVGLALSGGGIRSSTFNLGLLQGLNRLRLLPLLDYLSTVSGGGYVGSWWSAWRKRLADKQSGVNPAALPKFPHRRADQPEPDEVRHLREFSNFLAPRWGLFETEMWIALIAVLFGLGPTLFIGVVVIAIVQMCWLISTVHLSLPFSWVLPVLVVAPLIVLFQFAEKAWQTRRKSDQYATPSRTYSVTAFFALVLSLLIAAAWEPLLVGSSKLWMEPHGVSQVTNANTWARWMQHLGIEPTKRGSTEGTGAQDTTLSGELQFAVGGNAANGNAAASSGTTTINATLRSPQTLSWHFSARLFDVPAIWLIVGMLVSVLRIWVGSSLPRKYATSLLPPIDRVLLRLLALSVVVVTCGLLWELGVAVYRGGHLGKASIGAAGSGGLFALLRNWLVQLQSNQQKDSKWDAVKPYIPQLLAYVTAGLMYALVVAAAMYFLKDSVPLWMLAWFGCWLCIALALHLDPSEFGLHKLYRDRITRAFLGASHPDAYQADVGSFVARTNCYTDVRQNDDLPLTDLQSVQAPLHLVCCAANNLSGDQLKTLSRGARSAVLSCCGLSIGNRWIESPGTSLADAVTASAAAFNSQMGALSIKLGPAVGFLMSVLNLRLGIWISSPSSVTAQPRWFPGLLFLEEMFGLSDCGDESESHVHLSDGGHFENLALYELIRRHCRYIIVSDCGADPYCTFEDFGNALRRIREDFGVDIDIDLDPLRPGPDGESKQHVAVGTIRFDPQGRDFDIGVLIYFKPTLTGDEPCDISNYRALNPSFPHEATGDQFYDEAQWESYRRLGIHSVMEALSFLEGDDHAPASTPTAALKRIQWVFSRARDKWYPTPRDFERTLVDLNGRFVALEQRLAEKAPAWFVKELCPELESIAKNRDTVAQVNQDAQATPGDRLTEEREAVHLLVQMIQLIEDVWLTVDLGRNFNHPQMLGWVNAFQRWTHTETFRIWWPYLCPLYTPGMREFAKERFDLGQAAQPFEVTFAIHEQPSDLDVLEVAKRASSTESWANPRSDGGQTFEFVVFSILAKGVELRAGQEIKLPIAALRYVQDTATKTIHWNDDDFLIAHGMWGTGLGTAALKNWLGSDDLKTRKCVVTLDLDRTSNTGFGKHDVGHRRERNDLLNFYKRLGFVQSSQDERAVQLVCEPRL